MEATHSAAFDEVWEQVVQHLLPREGPFTAIDGGCGNAWAARRMAQHPQCESVVGVDAAAVMVDRADELSRNHGKVRCCVGNVATWQPEDRADVVCLCETLYLLDDPEAALTHVVQSWLNPVRRPPPCASCFPAAASLLCLLPVDSDGRSLCHSEAGQRAEMRKLVFIRQPTPADDGVGEAGGSTHVHNGMLQREPAFTGLGGAPFLDI